MEQYTYIKQNKANLLFCPFDRFGEYNNGKNTGRGRCGMVSTAIPSYTCVVEYEND